MRRGEITVAINSLKCQNFLVTPVYNSHSFKVETLDLCSSSRTVLQSGSSLK